MTRLSSISKSHHQLRQPSSNSLALDPKQDFLPTENIDSLTMTPSSLITIESSLVDVVDHNPVKDHNLLPIKPLPPQCAQLPLPNGYQLVLLTGSEQHRQDLLFHWLRLSDEDRRLRFFSRTSDEVLAHRVTHLTFLEPRLLAIYNTASELVACGEWARDFNDTEEAECAFSCDRSERGRGLSKLIGQACFLDAAQFGVFKARIETLRENGSARALAESLGAKWVSSGDGFGVARATIVNALANTDVSLSKPCDDLCFEPSPTLSLKLKSFR